MKQLHLIMCVAVLVPLALLHSPSSAQELGAAGEESPDGGASDTESTPPELVVFDLEYAPELNMRDSHRSRLEEAYWETVLEGPRFRVLRPRERNERMHEARQRITDTVDADRADLNSQAIEVPFYLVARISVEDEDHYRVEVILGASVAGEDGRTRLQATTEQRWTEVRTELVALLQSAVGVEAEE